MHTRKNEAIAVIVAIAMASSARAAAGQIPPVDTLEHAQFEFYSGRYEQAVAETKTLSRPGPDALPALELRTSALHFLIKRLLGNGTDKPKALKQCAPCAKLLEEFNADLASGRAMAKAQLNKAPQDQAALYFLGKFDLNEVWLNNSTLGRRTGFSKYKDGRRTMEAVLKLNPKHIRARVAHAWIDYIVDSRIPWGVRWVFGGGDRALGLQHMREAAEASTVRFEAAEAWFGLWEMLQREKQFDQALGIAKRLAKDFPENQEIQRFIANPKR